MTSHLVGISYGVEHLAYNGEQKAKVKCVHLTKKQTRHLDSSFLHKSKKEKYIAKLLE